MRRPVAVTGLAAEARIARAAGFHPLVGAGNRDRMVTLVERAVGEASCFVSFGIAGGLAAGLGAGTVILSGEVIEEDCCWTAEAGLRRRLGGLAREIGAIEGSMLGARSIIATRADKARARARTGALAADLESAAVARIACAAGLPFIVLRAIADTADDDLPPAALLPLTPSGTPRIGRVLGDLLRRPGQIAGLVHLARATRIALAALVGPARALHRLVA